MFYYLQAISFHATSKAPFHFHAMKYFVNEVYSFKAFIVKNKQNKNGDKDVVLVR